MPEKYRLAYLNVVCGNMTIPTATVRMEIDGHSLSGRGLRRRTGRRHLQGYPEDHHRQTARWSKFYVNAITGGTDAQGEVFVKLEENGSTVIGKGVDTDVVVASGKAYVNAINRIEFVKRKKFERV